MLTDGQVNRPVLYMVYSRSWFADSANLNSRESVYACPPPERKANSKRRAGEDSKQDAKKPRKQGVKKDNSGKILYMGQKPAITPFRG